MLQAFKAYIKRENLFQPNEKILLAVSGGIDSVAMTELFSEAKYTFGIAHANFRLRGEESEMDEHFVSHLAKKYKVPFFSRQFSTTEYADSRGLSTQMAARELRYTWFNELIEEEGFHAVATAHHLDDQIETFFINMLRSTGIAGFHGIMPRKGNVIRPLLFTSRQQIADFVKKIDLRFREDTSNQEVKYIRNKIRHELLPVLSEINPGYRMILTENIYRIREAETIFRETVEKAGKKVIRKRKEETIISIEKLRSLEPCKTYLFEFLSTYGFNYAVTENVFEALDEEAGKQFFSPTHRLIKDRNELIITQLTKDKKKEKEIIQYTIVSSATRIKVPLKLTLERLQKDRDFKIDPSPEAGIFDLHKITFPLTLRRWNHGDSFYPFGRNHRKKLSDFFTDNKFSISGKENTWILCSGEKIIWVVGHRIDNRFRVTAKTKQVLQIRWLK